MSPPKLAMDLEPGVHVTLKFHLPHRLIGGPAGTFGNVAKWHELMELVGDEVARVVDRLQQPQPEEPADGQ